MPASDAPRAPRLIREVDLDWRSVLVVLGAFVGLLAIRGLLRHIPRTITGLGVATIIALAINPLVSMLERRGLRRGPAVCMVLTSIAAVFAVLALLVVPPAVRQARDLADERATVIKDLGKLPLVGDQLGSANVQERVDRFIDELPDKLAGDTTPLEKAARSVADGVVATVVTLLFAITMLLDGPRLLRAARRLVPVERRSRADEVARLANQVVGRYVAGSLLVAGVCGLTILIAGLALGVPLTPLAALWAGLWDLVPQIGGAAGAIPFVILGMTKGAGTAVACLIVFFIYQQVKHQIIQPLLIGQAVKLSPPATMVAALVGVSAGGVVGALIAVPLVGAVKAVYLEFRRPPEIAPQAEPAA
jgi:predicted PurR-regulated permease PerM